MEVSDFGDVERSRARTLWGPSAAGLADLKRSTLAEVEFKVPLADVPR